jgi:hypothetical protein
MRKMSTNNTGTAPKEVQSKSKIYSGSTSFTEEHGNFIKPILKKIASEHSFYRRSTTPNLAEMWFSRMASDRKAGFFVEILMNDKPWFGALRSALCALRSALCALRSALCALRSALCALRSSLC